MKKAMNRSLALLLALAMCLSLWVVIPEASAATVEYRYGSTSEYSNCTNIIYNWGTRGTTATFLSPNAEAFYKDNNTSYTTLSALSGSSTASSVPSSKLYTTLRTLMTKNHTKVTTYNETRDMFAFTDCQGNAVASTKISSFYSGTPIGPAWDGGATWNREHTWPNSKGDANGNGENDIMMLRPASTSENSSRNNTAYGEGSSYYNPNKASNGKYDLRGDVARIVLYVYVRWQDTSKSDAVLFGTSGVIESKEVLLKWMEEDPVDTWEMGRNDSVESITGTRNVFVDYPELAFTLFGASVPSDLVTPSRGNGGGSSNTVTVRFMENGMQTKTLTVAPGEEVELPDPSITTNATYNFAGWTTKTVNETTTKPSNIYTAGATWAAAEQTFYALYTRVDTTTGGTSDVFALHTGAIVEGDYLLVSNGGAMATAVVGSSTRREVVDVTISNNAISGPAANLIWHIAPYENSYTIYNAAEAKYLAGTGYATAGLNLNKNITTYAPWTITPGNPAVLENNGNEAKGVNYTLRRNANNGFACYAPNTGTGITLYKAIAGTSYYSTSCGGACTHTNTTTSTQAATCTATGKTTVTCASCGQVISTTVLPAIGHNYAGGYCTGCGQADPNGGSSGNAGDFVLVTPQTVTEGQYVIGAVKDGKLPNLYLGTSAISGDWKITSTSVAVQNNSISADALPAGTQVLTLTGNNADGFTVGFAVNGTMQYLGYTSTTTSRKLALGTQYKNTLWKVVEDPDGGVALSSSYGAKSYVISQNSTADTAIRGYYTGTIYTGLYLFRQVEAAAEPVVSMGGEEYTNFMDAYREADDDYITLLTDLELDSLTLNKDLYLDLNGFDMTVDSTNAGGYRLVVQDSSTSDYSTVGGEAIFTGATITPANGYVLVGNTLNAYKLEITHISLDPANEALGFKAKLSGNSLVQNAVTGYGFEMGVEKTATYEKTGTLTNGQFTLRLKGILAANGGEREIRATAFLTLAGQTITTGQETATMRQAVEYANTNWSRLRPEQKTQMRILYMNYFDVIEGWLGENNNIA